MNIFEKMAEATARINTVAKNLSVSAGRSSYKAVGEADVLAAVKPIEKEVGIYSYPVARHIVESGEITSTSTYQGQTTERKQMFMRLETVYRFVNVEKPEEYIDITTYGDGVDTQDKAPGKAMTYGDKYALLKAYKIQTGDDPDQFASEDLKGARTERKAVSDKITPDMAKSLESRVQAMNEARQAVGAEPYSVDALIKWKLKEAVPVAGLTIPQYKSMMALIENTIKNANAQKGATA